MKALLIRPPLSITHRRAQEAGVRGWTENKRNAELSNFELTIKDEFLQKDEDSVCAMPCLALTPNESAIKLRLQPGALS